MKKFILPLLISLSLCGCTDLREVPQSELHNYVIAPDGAKNFKAHGGNWYTFDFDYNGKTNHILFYDDGVSERRTTAMTTLH